jgi:hypothetical protein
VWEASRTLDAKYEYAAPLFGGGASGDGKGTGALTSAEPLSAGPDGDCNVTLLICGTKPAG